MKALKTITIELLLLIIVAMSFIGFYKKDEYRVKNIIPEYKFGMNFTEQRVISMSVDNSIKETLIYDAEGKLIEDKQEGVDYTEENGYKTVEVRVNEEEKLTEENYEKTKNIILNRLHHLSIGEYMLNFDKQTGEIKIKLQENDNIDDISYYLSQNGKIKITDSETEELLLDETYIKDIGLLYGSNLNEEGKTESYVYLQLKFNEEGTKKLDELSKIYVATTTKVENEAGEEEEKTEEKKITITLNDTNLGSTIITNILYNNSLTICLGVSTDAEEFAVQTESANNIVKILKSGTFPIEYKFEEETLNLYQNEGIKLQVYQLAILLITILLCLYIVIRFKTRGLLASNLLIGYLATILIIVRFTNVIITETGMCGILFAVILNFIFLIKILTGNNNFNKVLIKHFLQFTPIYIISIILAFSNSAYLNSFGMTLTWGAMFIYIYNLIFAKPLIEILKEGKNEKK